MAPPGPTLFSELATRISPWLEPTLVFAVSLFLCLTQVSKAMEVHPDGIWHLLRVKDCLGGGGCHVSLGTPSIIGIRHGAVYLHFLVAVHWLGGDHLTAAVLFAVLSAFGALLLYLLSARLGGRLIAVVGAIAYALAVSTQHRTLWNPAMTPIFAVLCLLLLFCAARSSRPVHLFLLALTVSLGIQVHLILAALLLPLALLVLREPPRRRLYSAAVVAAVVAGGILLASPGMLDIDPYSLPKTWLLVGAPLAFAVIAPVFLYLAKRIGAFPALLVTCYLPIYSLLAFSGAGETRYLHGMLPGIVVLGVLTTGVAWRRFAGSIVPRQLRRADRPLGLLLLAFVVLHKNDRTDERPQVVEDAQGYIKHQTPLMIEARTLAEHLADRGVGYRQAFRGLRGGAGEWFMLNGLAYYLDAEGVDAPHGIDRNFAVHRVPSKVPRPTGPGWIFLEEAPGITVGLLTYLPWLLWDEFDFCLVEAGGECRLFRSRLQWLSDGEAEQWTARALPHLFMPGAPAGPFTLLIRVPVRIPADAGERIMEIPTVAGFQGCLGRVEDAVGVRTDDILPSKRATLRASSDSQEGFLLLAWSFGTEGCPTGLYRRMPPPVLEIQDAEDLEYLSRNPGELQRETVEGRPQTRRFLLAETGPPWDETEESTWGVPRLEPTVPLILVLLVTLSIVALLIGSGAMCVTFISKVKDESER